MKTSEKIGIICGICGVGIAAYLISKYVIAKKPSPTPTPTQTTTQPQTGTLRVQIDNESNQDAVLKVSNEDGEAVAIISIPAKQTTTKDITLLPGIYTIAIYYQSQLIYAKNIRILTNRTTSLGCAIPKKGMLIHKVI